MKIGSNIPKTLITLCKQDGRVTEVCNEGEDDNRPNNYWLTLVEGWHWCQCGSVHEHTIADCRQALKDVVRV